MNIMEYRSIADIFSAHKHIRENFLSLVGTVTADEAVGVPAGGGWPIGYIMEHVSIVEFSMLRICTKLVGASREAGVASVGGYSHSPEFAAKLAGIGETKVDAPERVHPTGGVTIADSLERLNATTASLEGLQPDLEAFDGTAQRFPHPFFGDLTAAEWLIVRGGHEVRHTKQIQSILAAIRVS